MQLPVTFTASLQFAQRGLYYWGCHFSGHSSAIWQLDCYLPKAAITIETPLT